MASQAVCNRSDCASWGRERGMHMGRWVVLLLLLLSTCKTTSQDGVVNGSLDDDLEALRAQYGVNGLNVGLLKGGRLVRTGAYGKTKADTIFSLASVSKIFVGLAAARALELGRTLDLDADVNDYLDWPEPLEHPDFPDQPVTLRQLMLHKAGIVSDGPEDYETYPKPDPTVSLEASLQAQLSNPEFWLPTAPGAAEEYSNLGAALAALVIQKVVGQPFEAFCNDQIFTPLGMSDTRWFFREFSAAQQARITLPYDEDGDPYQHYGFNDWPSGQLRSTVGDLAKALAMLIARGQNGGQTFLTAARVTQFQDTPFFIASESPGAYSHSGGESGVNTWVEYDTAGTGVIVLVNQDLAEGDDDALFEAVIARLKAE